MRRYVATLAAVFLLALAAAAQTKAELRPVPPPNFGSAHGACGPGHPVIQSILPGSISDPAPGRQLGVSVAEAVREYDLVLVGTPIRLVSAARPNGWGVNTAAIFRYPLILKSPPGGPRTGVAGVKVTFPGGTAMLGGYCTEDRGRMAGVTQLNAGRTYLVFAGLDPSRTGFVGGVAYPVSRKTAQLVIPPGHLWISFPRGSRLSDALAVIRAEVARERTAARKGTQQ